ncbi:phosphatidylinositol-specific phospholipase C domain-containing protein [Streptomyces sp. ST2-7A]|uniref:phosphatidylinositol-specific phospholipase C domain-containing protein n=1 Tax=Streptomyces sp. ST2-7A TaxID=2907214 RepID=UPI001F39D918|nr:phosphatidylinositol-specific phospholipase C domain-containing protein [Streptomyces sp. ST2-7A]MCE7081566.1 Ca2+-dependent phosphoinositide-specific phospholipase C [Streptomyces sp. ST2-7A]
MRTDRTPRHGSPTASPTGSPAPPDTPPAHAARHPLRAGAGVLIALLALLLPAANGLPYDDATGVGVHNAYQKSTFTHFADALDSGASMLELDVWTNFFGSGWRVSHDNPLVNDNNCENARNPSQLRTRARNQSLAGCLNDLRGWRQANPRHRPILLKLEMKDGFAANLGRGPAQLDALIEDILGDAVLRPADLRGAHATLDDAVRADGWPTHESLAGRVIIHLIPGTLEEGNPLDTLWTDVEYARHLRDLAAAGNLGRAMAFPAVHRAASGDPRTRYAETSIRPWFVVFDGDASAYGSIDTSWYSARNYLLVMTSAHAVAPAISATNPTEAQALDRVRLLSGRHASVVSSDWARLPGVLSTVVPRG